MLELSLRNCKVSVKKAVLVSDVIRGKPLDKALVLLANMKTSASKYYFSLLKSMSSNLENNHGYDYSDYYLYEVYACKGQVLKRIQRRAKGRADRRLKRYSNLFIKVKK